MIVHEQVYRILIETKEKYENLACDAKGPQRRRLQQIASLAEMFAKKIKGARGLTEDRAVLIDLSLEEIAQRLQVSIPSVRDYIPYIRIKGILYELRDYTAHEPRRNR